jgi:tRNA threonylcarbamoyladenosine biosynthesis protein TsaB
MSGVMRAKLLGIDTSNGACSVALWLDGECSQRYQVAPRGHGLLLLPMVESLLAEAGIAAAQLDALVLGRGPGSFTGLRIATGVVQGLAFSLDRLVVPISSLAALAQGSQDAEGKPAARVLTAFDARMGEVYWAAWQRDAQGLVRLA